MKVLKNIIVFTVFSLLVFNSCSEDFLREDPKDKLFINNYYKTQEDAISAVNSVYAYLNAQSEFPFGGVYFDDLWTVIGEASDEMQNNSEMLTENEAVENFTFATRNSKFRFLWGIHYKTIWAANIAIEKIPQITTFTDTALKTQLINEAKFLRALMYFNLVRMFGDVPMPLTFSGAPLQADVVKEEDIYKQIILDLKDAENLPSVYPGGLSGHEKGRAVKWAAKGILARVYLTIHDYENAAAKAKEIIDSKQYQLLDNVADVYKIANRGSREHIFSVGFGDQGNINFWEQAGFNVRLLPRQFSTAAYDFMCKNTNGWLSATDYLYKSFETGDKRKELIITNVKNDKAGNLPKDTLRYIGKYWDQEAEPVATDRSAVDFPLLRYPDILLMYAEASYETGNISTAFDFVDMVRQRAQIPPLNRNLNRDEFIDAVYKERLLEFVCEGQRWFDLARRPGMMEKWVSKAKPGIVVTPKHYHFPIPETEIELNPKLLENTSGYY